MDRQTQDQELSTLLDYKLSFAQVSDKGTLPIEYNLDIVESGHMIAFIQLGSGFDLVFKRMFVKCFLLLDGRFGIVIRFRDDPEAHESVDGKDLNRSGELDKNKEIRATKTKI